MGWKKWMGRFGLNRKPASEDGKQKTPDIPLIAAEDNPFGVALLDIRPVTQTLTSYSKDPQCSENVMSYRPADCAFFATQRPAVEQSADIRLTYRLDRQLADGILFMPQRMEHKWAIFCHGGKILVVRSWQRELTLIAHTEAHGDRLDITRVEGSFAQEDEDPAFTRRQLDYLLRSHVLGLHHPVPLKAGMADSPYPAALECFIFFGDRAHFASEEEVSAPIPDQPLRSDSLLHIAAVRGDIEEVRARLATHPVDLRCSNGQAPLHWALDGEQPEIVALLLEHGSPVDIATEDGTTPLMFAIQARSAELTGFLLEHGADPDARDHRGFTALHRAAEMGSVEIVGMLLARGARREVEAQGHTPLSLAKREEHHEIVAMLEKT